MCVACVLALAACGDDFVDFDASTPSDAGVPNDDAGAEGGVPVRAVFTVSGCDHLDFDLDARPRCTAPRGRPLTFVPLGVGVDTVVWTFPGATPSSSTILTPEARWAALGSYTVSLASGGGGATALGTGFVQIAAGGAGAACGGDVDCDASLGLTCLCGDGAGCPAPLSAGLCARRCESVACAPGEVCADLTRGGAALADGGAGDGGADEAFRARVCLPACTADASCRSGLSCLELPVVAPGAPAGGPYGWASACFAPVAGEVGAPCRAPGGLPDGSRCLSGQCEALGARGVCSASCAGMACPAGTACATVPQLGARCLARCAAGDDCHDPLMACQPAGAGGLGYSLPPAEPVGTTLCTPKRCALAADCAPAGQCSDVGGAKFCVP